VLWVVRFLAEKKANNGTLSLASTDSLVFTAIALLRDASSDIFWTGAVVTSLARVAKHRMLKKWNVFS
jgi:hypothetical protein